MPAFAKTVLVNRPNARHAVREIPTNLVAGANTVPEGNFIFTIYEIPVKSVENFAVLKTAETILSKLVY